MFAWFTKWREHRRARKALQKSWDNTNSELPIVDGSYDSYVMRKHAQFPITPPVAQTEPPYTKPKPMVTETTGKVFSTTKDADEDETVLEALVTGALIGAALNSGSSSNDDSAPSSGGSWSGDGGNFDGAGASQSWDDNSSSSSSDDDDDSSSSSSDDSDDSSSSDDSGSSDD